MSQRYTLLTPSVLPSIWLQLYESRPDRTYSLVDCISMNAMREEGITDALTNDHHFTQEGFTILISVACSRLATPRRTRWRWWPKGPSSRAASCVNDYE